MVQRPQLNVLEKVRSKDATEEAPVEDPPTWDEVEADIDNWYNKMAQRELDEESEGGEEKFAMEFNSLIWNKYVKNPYEGDSSKVRGKRPEQDQDGIDPE